MVDDALQALRNENDALRARLSVLEAANATLHTFRALADNAPDAILLAGPDGSHVYCNKACCELFGMEDEDNEDDDDACGRVRILEHVVDAPGRPGRRALEAVGGGVLQDVFVLTRKDGTTFHGQVTAFAVREAYGQRSLSAFILRDITEQMRAEAARVSFQQRIIEAQRAALRQLSTPLIPIAEHVLAIPLIGSMDDERARQLLDVLLRGVEQRSAHVVLLDVTGVPTLDAPAADALVRAARAVRLLGARLVLTGIRPEVARALVHLETNLDGIVIQGSLEQGIAYALSARARPDPAAAS